LGDDIDFQCQYYDVEDYLFLPDLTGEAWSIHANTAITFVWLDYAQRYDLLPMKVGFDCLNCTTCSSIGCADCWPRLFLVGQEVRVESCFCNFCADDYSDWFGGPEETEHLTGKNSFSVYGQGGPPFYGNYSGLLVATDRWESIGPDRSWDKVIPGDFDGDGDTDLWSFDDGQGEAMIHWNMTNYGDCDGDGVADETQLANNPSLDCNADGVLDSCQIAANPDLDWNGDGVLDSCAGGGFVYCSSNPNAIGQVGSLKPQGSPLIADDAFTLYGHNLPLSQPAMVIMSRSTNYVNPFGGGAGVLCLGAPIRRFNMAAGFPLQFTSPTGEFSLSPSIGQFPGPNAVLPGEVIHFQLWHREFDPATGVPRSNTTDGISVMFR
jgi:hypothetical protein